MSTVAPGGLDEVIDVLTSDPDAQLLAGGTDFMVEVNFGHRRPRHVVSLHRVAELRGWHRDGDHVVLGAGLRYFEMEVGELARLVPCLAQAARTALWDG